MSMLPYRVYVSSYAAADQPALYLFTFHETTGTLTAQGSFTGIANPSFLAVHPSGRWIYVVSELHQQFDGAPGSVWALRCIDEPWNMEPINHQASGGDWPCHLEIDAGGRWLLVSNYASGTVGVFPILEDGALGEMTDRVQHSGKGPHSERQEGPHTHSTLFTPDQRFVLVADLGLDALVLYAFDAGSGRLHEHQRTSTRAGAGPRHMVFHPNGKHLFVANELDNTVTCYTYDAVSGQLHEQQMLSTLPPNAPENAVADIHISSAGNRLYVSNRGHDSIAGFEIEVDGRLTQSTYIPSGGQGPRNFALAPDGRYLLVANQQSSELVVLPVSGGSDGTDDAKARFTVHNVSCIRFVTNNS